MTRKPSWRQPAQADLLDGEVAETSTRIAVAPPKKHAAAAPRAKTRAMTPEEIHLQRTRRVVALMREGKTKLEALRLVMPEQFTEADDDARV